MPALDRLGLASLPRGSRILDLCCGTGHLAAALSRRGFEVTGLDESQDMLRFARQNAPEAEFLISDARQFKFSNRFDAVISTGDSLNHILTKHDLNLVFRNVLAALVAGGRFTFDMNMAQAFETQWSKSSTDIGDDRLIYIRGRYDKSERLGSTEVTLFEKAGEWKRVDLKMFQRCYIQRDVKSLLLQSGFVELVVRPAKYFGIRGRLAIGRTFFAGRKPQTTAAAA
jgi:SAM-dependent methyltransferase